MENIRARLQKIALEAIEKKENAVPEYSKYTYARVMKLIEKAAQSGHLTLTVTDLLPFSPELIKSLQIIFDITDYEAIGEDSETYYGLNIAWD